MLQQGVHAKHGVVWLDHCSGNLGAGPDGEADLGFLAIVNREALQHQATKTAASSATNCIVDHEALQASAIVRKLADAVKHQVNNLFTNVEWYTLKLKRILGARFVLSLVCILARWCSINVPLVRIGVRLVSIIVPSMPINVPFAYH